MKEIISQVKNSGNINDKIIKNLPEDAALADSSKDGLQIIIDEDLDLLDQDETDHALFSALLFDGIQAYLSGGTDKDKKNKLSNKIIHNESIGWINEREDEYAFSFENVCTVVGVDPDMLRLGLANIMVSSKGKTSEASNKKNK